jgi:hypothetical protein
VLYRAAEVEWRQFRRNDSLRAAGKIVADDDQRILRVAGVTIIADTVIADVVERAARGAHSAVAALYGTGAVTTALSGEQWYINLDSADSGRRRDGSNVTVGVRELSGRASRIVGIGTATRINEAEIRDILRRRSDAAMITALGHASRWVGRPLGAGENSRYYLEVAFRDLAIGPTPGSRECNAGNIAVCRQILGVDRADSLYRSSTTLSEAARASLLRLAIERGGAGAFDRFMSDTTQSISLRLENASGIAADSLIRSWLDLTRQARPQPASTSPRTALLALLWSTVLCAASLRSSRWR